MRRAATTCVAALTVVGAMACGRPEEGAKPKDPEPKSEGKSAAVRIPLVPPDALGDALPEGGAWQRGEVTGRAAAAPFATSQAEATYARGDGRIQVVIIDTALNEMLFAPFSMYLAADYSERLPGGFRKSASVKGHPAFEEVSTTNKTATITAVVNKRFIVHGRGREISGAGQVRALLERLDFGRLPVTK